MNQKETDKLTALYLDELLTQINLNYCIEDRNLEKKNIETKLKDSSSENEIIQKKLVI